MIERAVGAGEHARADLDDDGVGRGGNFLANEIGHRGGTKTVMGRRKRTDTRRATAPRFGGQCIDCAIPSAEPAIRPWGGSAFFRRQVWGKSHKGLLGLGSAKQFGHGRIAKGLFHAVHGIIQPAMHGAQVHAVDLIPAGNCGSAGCGSTALITSHTEIRLGGLSQREPAVQAALRMDQAGSCQALQDLGQVAGGHSRHFGNLLGRSGVHPVWPERRRPAGRTQRFAKSWTAPKLDIWTLTSIIVAGTIGCQTKRRLKSWFKWFLFFGRVLQ